MANTLGVYNPIFYANEALIHLRNALGMAGRVHRGYDAERRSFGKGEVINIRKPHTFTVEDAPATAQDLDTETIPMTLAYWREAKFKLTDRELAFTGERIITDHIKPAAYALANDIDQKMTALTNDVPWLTDWAGTGEVSDITNLYQVMFDNGVPMEDIHLMINGTWQNRFQQLTAFSQQQGAGAVGVETQMRGSLGQKFGYEIFANQNVVDHTKGTADDTALEMNAAAAKGAATIDLRAVDAGVAGTLAVGDTFVIAGNTQRYAVTALNTASSNVFTGVAITPALAQAHAEDDAVTVNLDTHSKNCGFHRNAFALAMAPLSEMGNELGANIFSITDPVTSLALRARLYYMPNVSEVHVAIDVLYGVKTLDPNLAAIGQG